MNETELLPEIVRRESRTFLQYVREAFPWAKGSDEPLRARLLGLAEVENEAVAKMGRRLQQRRIPLPFLGAFPTSFMHSNFLSLGFVVPKLVKAHRQDLELLDREVNQVSDPEFKQLLDEYRSLKRHHLQDLESIYSRPV